MKWDWRWMELAMLVSTWSKDDSKKVGAVVVDDRNNVVALGWNGICRGVNDHPDLDHRHDRDQDKYKYYEHAERNAVYNAASTGAKLRDCRIYVTCCPCADCARAIIQTGIKALFCPPPPSGSRWLDHFAAATEMLQEARVSVTWMEHSEAVEAEVL